MDGNVFVKVAGGIGIGLAIATLITFPIFGIAAIVGYYFIEESIENSDECE